MPLGSGASTVRISPCLRWVSVPCSSPFAAVWFAYMFFFALAHKLKLVKIACILVLLISFAVFGSMIERDYLQGEIDGAVLNRFQHGLGGTAGQMIYENFLATSLGLIGSLIVFGVLGTVLLCLFTARQPLERSEAAHGSADEPLGDQTRAVGPKTEGTERLGKK